METVISGTKISVAAFREMRFEDDDDYYYEIINGEMIQKSAPTPLHQRVCKKLVRILDDYSNEKQLGEVFQSPIDVFLDDYNKPQPDILFVSNDKKAIITNDGIIGVPDLIIEIMSTKTYVLDRFTKRTLYERNLVQEFWIVDPKNAYIEIATLKNNQYELLSVASVFERELTSALFEGLTINLNEIFTS